MAESKNSNANPHTKENKLIAKLRPGELMV